MRLGYRHPKYLLRELSSAEIADWLAFYRLWPWGDLREELRHGQLLAMLFNRHRQKGEPSKTARQYMTWERPADQTPDEQWHLMRSVFGGNSSSS